MVSTINRTERTLDKAGKTVSDLTPNGKRNPGDPLNLVDDFARIVTLNDPVGALQNAYDVGRYWGGYKPWEAKQITTYETPSTRKDLATMNDRKRQQSIRAGKYNDKEWAKYVKDNTVNGRIYANIAEAEGIREYLRNSSKATGGQTRAKYKYQWSAKRNKNRRKQYQKRFVSGGSKRSKSVGKRVRRWGGARR